jgi:glycerophosphoryl diester phosphodiesterase
MKRLFLALGLTFLLQAQPPLAFDLQGHRGARGLAPENTLASFATALFLGVPTPELDAGMTIEGPVVIAQDMELNPDVTRDATGLWLSGCSPAIHSLSFRDSQKHDVGRTKSLTDDRRQFPEQKAAHGSRILGLKNLFVLVNRAGNGEVGFNFGIKRSPLPAAKRNEAIGLRTTSYA